LLAVGTREDVARGGPTPCSRREHRAPCRRRQGGAGGWRGRRTPRISSSALAKIIETIVAVTVRKVTEKAAWCWYACELEAAPALVQPAERMELRLVVGDEASS
jgi:hypothetical protein